MSQAYISNASSSQLPYHKNLSASLKISLSYQAVYQYLLDNLVSGPSFVPTIIAALHPSNRLWAPVCPDLLWHSQATSVDDWLANLLGIEMISLLNPLMPTGSSAPLQMLWPMAV